MLKETKTYQKLKDLEQNNFPKWVVVHHTGGSDKYPRADTSDHTAEDVENWHLSEGWDGIGYHYFIEENGKIYKGRPEHRNGAHAKGYNTKSIGVCLAGNFDVTDPTEQQTKSLTSLLRGLTAKYNIPASKIIPHRRVARKTCFGKRLPDDWAKNLVSSEHKCKELKDYDFMELVEEFRRRFK